MEFPFFMASQFEDERAIYRRRSQERIQSNIEDRLIALHDFSGTIAEKILGISQGDVLEVGGDTGFQIPTITKYASHVTSIDFDPVKVRVQMENPQLQPLISTGKLDVLEMDVRDMSGLGKNRFDLVTAHGIFGDGFSGDSIEDVVMVFDQIREVLKPGGIMVASFADERIVEAISTFGIKTSHGFPVDIEDVKDYLLNIFPEFLHYGQLFWTFPVEGDQDLFTDSRLVHPIGPAMDAYKPKLISSHFFDSREVFTPNADALKPELSYLYIIRVPTFHVLVCGKSTPPRRVFKEILNDGLGINDHNQKS